MIKEVSSWMSCTLLFSTLLTPIALAADTGTLPQTSEVRTEAQQENMEGDKAGTDAATETDADAAAGADGEGAESGEQTPAAGETKTSFKDLESLPQDERKRIEALVSAGIFNGISEDSFGVDEQVNRAQFAKIAALIFKLKVDESLRQSSFIDLLAEDPAHSYALPYVEALKEAGLTNGSDAEGKRYNPAGAVSREELAAFLIRGMGLEKEAQEAKPAADGTVSDWARGYAALAVEKKLIAPREDGTFGGSEPALRRTLAMAAYEIAQPKPGEGQAEEEQSGKISIVEVKAIKSNVVSVKLNRTVDTTAELSITRKGLKAEVTNVNSTEPQEVKPLSAFVQWTDDKLTEASMELDVKLEKGPYIITLKGLPEDQVEIGEFEFEAENERVEKIEITAPSDTLPQSMAMIPYKAINQYGEETALKPSNVKIMAGAVETAPILVPGSRYLTVDLSKQQQGSQVHVSLMDYKSIQTASKSFTVGTLPQVTKLEVGELKFNDGQSIFKTGYKAFLNFEARDQYGNRIVDPGVLNSSMGINVFMEPQDVIRNDKSVNNFQDMDNDGYPELQLEAFPKLKIDKEVTVHMLGAAVGQDVTKKLKVAAPKAPVSVDFYAWDKNLADGDADKLVELRVKDATGYQLTVDEIVYAEQEGQLRFTSSGPLVLESDAPTRMNSSGSVVGDLKLVNKTGGDKGKIRIKQINGYGPASIMVHLVELNQIETLKLDIGEKRVPNSLVTGTAPNDDGDIVQRPLHFSIFQNTSAGPNFNIKDQYGENFGPSGTNYMVDLKLERTSGEAGAIDKAELHNKSVLNDVYSTKRIELKDFNNRQIKFYASMTKQGSYKLTATLVEINPGDQSIVRTLGSIVSTAEVVNPATADIKYSLEVEDSLFAAGRSLYDRNLISSVTDITYILNHYPAFGQILEVRGKNALGTEYSTKPKVLGITSNSTKVIGHVNDYGKNKESYLIGLESGKAKVTVFFEAFNGEISSVSKDVVVNADELYVKESKMNDSDVVKKNGATLDLNGRSVWDTELVGTSPSNFQIRDQYGHDIDRFISTYSSLLDVRLFIGNVKYIEPYTNPTDTRRDQISVGADYTVTYTRNGEDKTKNNIREFTLYMASSHGLKKKRFILYP